MPEQQVQQVDWNTILKDAGPYPIEAFNFVQEGLRFTVNRCHANAESLSLEDRHISGQQLCLGLRDFAVDQYGMMAPAVLRHWHISRTDDFGRIVFAMIAAGMMTRTDEDTIEDFRAVYDFDEAFSRVELLNRVGRS